MHLTKEEERIYVGEYGWAHQTCMKILVKLGELFNAEKLITIDSAHVSGVSYKTLGDAPIEFLQALADAEAKAKTKTTLNPQSLDHEYLGKKLPEQLLEPQLRILKQFERMGVTPSLTCTPYYMDKPRPNAHLAWAESSAVVYANSVLNAWTNREGGPSALAAAVIGKTPDYGLHKAENRQAKVLVSLETRLKNETEFGALGICLGKTLRDEIPSIPSLQNGSKDDLKQFSAALATTGMTNMFTFEKNSENRGNERISVEAKEIRRTVEGLSTTSTTKPDLVFIGCPHCSLNEVRQIACLVGGRKVKDGTEFWICTSNYVKEKANNYVKKIEGSGGHVLPGVCTVVSWTEAIGIKTIMTNSAKTAYYAPTFNKAETMLAPLKECLTAAFRT